MNEQLAERVKAKARDLGFDLVGITGAEPSAFAAEYREWLERGFHGEMGYMARNVERRLDPSEILPGARSIIVVGMNYYSEEPSSDRAAAFPRSAPAGPDPADATPDTLHTNSSACDPTPDPRNSTPDAPLPIPDPGYPTPDTQGPTQAIFARYARGDDYHDVMTPRLRELLSFLKAEVGEGAEGRVYVDTGPVLEREVARRAGLGWFGKNTMLINTRRGSYFFLGEIVTNVPLSVDAPAVGGCGTCTRCIDACPTGAITAPYALDSRRCISYLTIELKGPIPAEFQPAIAETGRIYGCDICQEVCPFNRPASAAHPTLVPTGEPAYQPRPATTGRAVEELALLTDEEFRQQFRGSPVKRTKWRGLKRNAAAALRTRDGAEAIAELDRALNDPEELVRRTGAQAFEQSLERNQV